MLWSKDNKKKHSSTLVRVIKSYKLLSLEDF